MHELSGSLIPHSVVHLSVECAPLELVSELLATRSSRDLQSVDLGIISDSKAAALAGELVSTDPHKQWKCTVTLLGDTATSFSQAAIGHSQTSARSSLTDLNVTTGVAGWSPLIAVLCATPGLTNFELRRSMVNGFARVVASE